ncbi:MAG: cytochrome c biogenesis protein CcdA [bacterium]|nr:cytochrome c biogenesis protein CcdA [bacterium]
MDQNNSISLLMAFSSGVLSFISPCVLPLIPGYISIITGLSFDELNTSSEDYKVKIFVSTLFFVFGFSSVFILMGASATFIGQLIFRYSNSSIVRYISGILIIVFGLHFSGIFKLNFLYKEKKLFANKVNKMTLLGVFLMGAVFALGWTPCIGPILSSILLYASTKETMKDGLILLSVYSLGLGIPFIITGIAFSKFLKLSSGIKKHYRWVEIISGTILILIGILIITNNFQKFSFWLIGKFQ